MTIIAFNAKITGVYRYLMALKGNRMSKWSAIENITILIMTASIILGTYFMGAGGYAFLGLFLLLCMNHR